MIQNGIDIVEIDRIEKSIQNEAFKTRVYGKEELCELENEKPENYAGVFCAKEAFSKAIGTGIRGFSLNEVQVLHDQLGAPYFSFSGNALKSVLEKGMKFSLSISHSKQYAVASVIAYTED